MKFRTKWIAAPALLLATLAGCGLGDDDSFQRDKLTAARARWESKNLDSYSYILELQCFCGPSADLRPVLVTVQDGTVASVQYYHENPAQRTPASATIFGPYDTVDELFEIVEDAIEQDADVLQVGYDAEYGFPNAVNLDLQAGGSEQVLFFVTSFTPATTAP